MAKTGGRQAKSDEWKRARGALVRALREKLELTQDVVADRGGFPRAKMSKFESGVNAATTAEALRELAAGFGTDWETMALYLDEALDTNEVISMMRTQAKEEVESQEGRVRTGIRYDNLRRVLEAPRMQGRWAEPTIAAAKSLQLDADEDPDDRWWVETLDRLDAAIKVSVPKVPPRGSPLDDIDENAGLRSTRKKR